jgi:hypothetical protein
MRSWQLVARRPGHGQQQWQPECRALQWLPSRTTIRPSYTLPAEARARLSDRAFHLQLDQAFELDAVFHGELTDEIVDETVDA